MSDKKFELTYAPVDYVLSIHIRNLFITFGEEKVRSSLKELFNIDISEDQIEQSKVEGMVNDENSF